MSIELIEFILPLISTLLDLRASALATVLLRLHALHIFLISIKHSSPLTTYN